MAVRVAGIPRWRASSGDLRRRRYERNTCTGGREALKGLTACAGSRVRTPQALARVQAVMYVAVPRVLAGTRAATVSLRAICASEGGVMRGVCRRPERSSRNRPRDAGEPGMRGCAL